MATNQISRCPRCAQSLALGAYCPTGTGDCRPVEPFLKPKNSPTCDVYMPNNPTDDQIINERLEKLEVQYIELFAKIEAIRTHLIFISKQIKEQTQKDKHDWSTNKPSEPYSNV